MSSAKYTLRSFKEHIRCAGGFVHSDLTLLVGDAAEHGQVSLSGVVSDEMSLMVPWSIGESVATPGPWMSFLADLGYDVFCARYSAQNSVNDLIMPLFAAANHSKTGGRVELDNRGVRLYGTSFRYCDDPATLLRVWDIYES